MKPRLGLTVGGIVLGLTGWAVVSYATSRPVYLRDGETSNLTCYGGEPKGMISVRSTDEGQTADVTYDGRTHQLRFSGSFLFTDYYSDGTIHLSLDPEGRLDNFPDGPGGLCAA